ncbi:methylated-DNA--[protein]-cysteine S-methyltransferase [Paenarthrobacter sp. Z7-10]|uniref:methylated-DNA--[protein]-cysteine S-methyltransferase n=1 Tax=Paenarthrobacter sp. Z7-10 TaxID=2787635 RepID=UPI0022A950C1|nr:methylated-DNA--[protein]-cysteine S-methyltransferase [Paenarthrobacter sp. Z7-10]MCZ2404977.1 methylated-DNA--[protein]-cysteine S-methyltransferase [Paenarthrobacter sp. Z7-10]
MDPQEAVSAALLAPLGYAEEPVLERLHARLAAAAERSGDLDITYRTIDTPVGTLLLAATAQGLLRVAYERENHDHVLEKLSARISPRILKSAHRLEPVVRELEEYFSGTRSRFDLPLDLSLSSGYRREVLAHLPRIGYGHTESYAQVALATGNPKAVRAVGTACATNPLPVVVPCHRVVRSDGSAGGYVGGPDAKAALLMLERAV